MSPGCCFGGNTTARRVPPRLAPRVNIPMPQFRDQRKGFITMKKTHRHGADRFWINPSTELLSLPSARRCFS